MSGRREVVFILTSLVLACGVAASADDAPTPDYQTQIAPLFNKYCAGCHDDDGRDAGLSLASFESLQQGLEDGPAVLAGDSAGSRIIRVMTGDAETVMPPEGEPRPTDEEIALIAAWIDAGAPGPDGAEYNRLMLIVPDIDSQSDVSPITALAVSAVDSRIAIGRYGKVEVFALGDGQSLAEGLEQPVLTLDAFPGKVNAIHFSPDGSQIITASGVSGLGGVAAIWNATDGSLIREFNGHRDTLYDAELSPDGATLATCSYDRTIRLWDVATGDELRALTGHNGAVYDVAYHPSSQFLVSASADDTCKVWRVSDGERLDTLGQPTKEQYACAFTPDGQFIVAGGADNRIRVWRFISTSEPRINPLIFARFAHEGPILEIDFSADGSTLYSSAEDRTLKAWDTAEYTERQVWEGEPAVAMTLAAFSGRDRFLVGRMDGSVDLLEVTARNAADAAAVADMPTIIPQVAGDMQQTTETEPNDTPEQANALHLPGTANGVIEGNPNGVVDSDLYRFSARAGEEWVVEVNAARAGSQLDSFIEVLDSAGQPIERVLLQAVRDSYYTFRGKDNTTVDDFRVFNWEEMDLNQYLYSNGEVVKLWLYPRGPDSGFMVYPGQGSRWGWFDTTPLAHALGEPCYIVEPLPPGTEIIPNGLPVFPIYFENDDDARRELGADSRLYFTAPADGDYLVRIRDVRGFEGADQTYALTIRPRQPDFRVTVHNTGPTVNAGSGKEFRITAQRIDNFSGPIRVDLSGLPPGFSVTTPIVIEEGQIEALGVITAASDAPPPTAENASTSIVTATASILGQDVTHEAGSLGEIKLAEAPKLLARIVPREGGAVPIAEPADGPLEFEMHPGETIMLGVILERNGFDGVVGFGTAGAGRNLPFGVYIDNLGLNGLLLLDGQTEREFFVTASPWVEPQSRLFFINAGVEGGQTSQPVLLHIRGRDDLASGDK